MFYVYILKSKKDKRLYIGYTADLRKRLVDHNKGKTKSTKHRRPLKLIYYEAYKNKKDATQREYDLKHKPDQKKFLKKQIINSLSTFKNFKKSLVLFFVSYFNSKKRFCIVDNF